MAFCMHCGAPVDGVPFCPVCGTVQKEPILLRFGRNRAVPPPAETGPTHDIADNRWMATLAYLGPLCLIPFFAAQHSPFARAHAAQGMRLLLFEAAYLLGTSLLNALLSLFSPQLALVCSAVFAVCSLVFAVLSALGIVCVRRGEYRGLPLIPRLRRRR